MAFAERYEKWHQRRRRCGLSVEKKEESIMIIPIDWETTQPSSQLESMLSTSGMTLSVGAAVIGGFLATCKYRTRVEPAR